MRRALRKATGIQVPVHDLALCVSKAVSPLGYEGQGDVKWGRRRNVKRAFKELIAEGLLPKGIRVTQDGHFFYDP